MELTTLYKEKGRKETSVLGLNYSTFLPADADTTMRKHIIWKTA